MAQSGRSTTMDTLRVFVSSTSKDLDAFRQAARDVILDIGWQFVGMEHFGTGTGTIVNEVRRKVDDSDLVVLIQAFRQGWVPTVEEGGDGETSITGLEYRESVGLKTPVRVFLAEQTWPGHLWEDDARARTWVHDFRNGLNRMAVFFSFEQDPLDGFRALLRQELVKHKEEILRKASGVAKETNGERASIRLSPPTPIPALPEVPYPVLEPYRHPALFAGRDDEIEALVRRVHHEGLVLCVHACSGAGKSSLLGAALVPRLQAEGHAVSMVRHPEEPQLAQGLLAEVVKASEGVAFRDDDWRAFGDTVAQVRRLSGRVPVFVVDQLDDVFRNDRDRAAALARLGPLLAATAQRQPGIDGAVCRWVLCYRDEFHGEVVRWLGDVLEQARAAGRAGLDTLPHDLSDLSRRREWALPVFAKPLPDGDPLSAATPAFLDAIERPLTVVDGANRPKYAVRFVDGGTRRLAEAFARSRLARPDAPLVPELQVVLAHLLEGARRLPGGTREVEVPDGPALDQHIAEALEAHLRRALAETFPLDRTGERAGHGRARALLALRELADAMGRRGKGLPREDLMRAIGAGGDDVLDKLASDTLRVVTRTDAGGTWVYALSHDRLAEVVTRIVDDQGGLVRLQLDQGDRDVIALRRFVRQKSDLYFGSHDPAALDLDETSFRAIEDDSEALLLDDERKAWWEACRRHRAARRRGRRRAWAALAVVALIVVLSSVAVYMLWLRPATLFAELGEQLTGTDPQSDFAAVTALAAEHEYGWGRIGRALPSPDPRLFVEGPVSSADGNEPPLDAEELLDLIDQVHPVFVGTRASFGALMFVAEDVARRRPDLETRARVLSKRIRAEFMDANDDVGAPPSAEEDAELNPRVMIRGDGFSMGSPDGVGDTDEHPMRWVQLSDFEIQSHEVTITEYRRFDPDHDTANADGTLPVTGVSWYEAFAYAAWLGGTLPTEAQWEFAARGREGREYPWREGELTCERANYFGCEGLLPTGSRPAGATPEGVLDLSGNALEWCRDWYGEYPEEDEVDPLGPLAGALRVVRGGSFYNVAGSLRAAVRYWYGPDLRLTVVGFRVVVSPFFSDSDL